MPTSPEPAYHPSLNPERRKSIMAVGMYGNIALFLRLLSQTRRHWPSIGCLFLLGLLSIPLALLTPVPLQIAVDSVLGTKPLPNVLAAVVPSHVAGSKAALLHLVLGLLLGVALLTRLRILGDWMLLTYTGEKMVLGFRAVLFHHVQRLSISYHDSKGTTDSSYRIQYDAPAIQRIAINGVIPLVSSMSTLAAMFYVTARIDWRLAAVALAVAPAFGLLFWIYSTRLRKQWNDVASLESRALAVIQEVLAAVRLVKAFGKEGQEKDRFVRRADEGVKAKVRAAFSEGSFGLILGMTIATGTAAVLFIGVRQVQSSALTLGELLLVMSYLTQLYDPVQTISSTVANLQEQLARAERAFSVLDQAPDVPERTNARSLQRAQGAVAFRDVTFGYDQDRPVLSSVSFEIPAGARVGIAGTTGAGKTTLVNLLTRFYDPSDGVVLLDGIDLRDYKVAHLRDQFALVLQDPLLFSATIAENIAYARPDASMEEIREAAQKANAHEFIIGLADRYDTQVGERGMRLSGGERQRISLARAFLKDAPILILDEPTSSVDLKTEAAIMASMDRLMTGRTSLLITHRKAPLSFCDIVLKVDRSGVSQETPGGCEPVL